MSINATLSTLPLHYSINRIKDEVCSLYERRIIRRSHQLYVLCEHLPAREWLGIECEIERSDYLLRDRVSDLIGEEKWEED
jgi:hypothetical protein